MSDQPDAIDSRIKFLDGVIADLEKDTMYGPHLEAWSTMCKERAVLHLTKQVQRIADILGGWADDGLPPVQQYVDDD